ncbi:flagellar basal-body rod protein FlgG [Vogesella sp. LIG4]|uniref:flagellar basal-body rod protein FlgG n=1 Tax=Vogesella sp. LIG4 TaxID=1192162 RepID=UPI00081F9D40|nr:flagellar basal-body rod protein FlgG [Vogesella sp. LIG4]SCK30318.1 flagellar basal-body rod protein FlgG [Vogesella sp. LIG4]
MMRSLYIGKTGMESSQFRLDVISNNLANVGTKAFKRSSAVFQDLMYQTLREPGSRLQTGEELPTGLHIGLGSAPTATARSHTQGSLSTSGNVFDLAINGRGFFKVTLPDGETGYTRDGEFQRGATGRLETSEGYPLQPELTVPDGTGFQVAEDGTVSYIPAGSSARADIGQLQLADFINPAGLESLGGNLYRETTASGAPIAGTGGLQNFGTIKSGFLEESNVNVAEELVGMIQAQRAYEMNSRSIKTSDEMLQRLTQM